MVYSTRYTAAIACGRTLLGGRATAHSELVSVLREKAKSKGLVRSSLRHRAAVGWFGRTWYLLVHHYIQLNFLLLPASAAASPRVSSERLVSFRRCCVVRWALDNNCCRSCCCHRAAVWQCREDVPDEPVRQQAVFHPVQGDYRGGLSNEGHGYRRQTCHTPGMGVLDINNEITEESFLYSAG